MMPFSVIGKPAPRIEGQLKATGEAKYCDDMFLPGMLHGKMLRSPHPHARILNINAEKARRLPGVRAVMTGKDVPNKKYGTSKSFPETLDESVLCLEKARFLGDPVAAVAATDEGLAQEALDLIEVDYEVLPAVFDPEEAMVPGAPLIHDKPNNIAWEVYHHYGDVEKGFEQSDFVRVDEFMAPAQNHAALEPHSAVASFDRSGKLTLYSCVQSPYVALQDLAFVLGLKPRDIRVISPYIGGGFGGKYQILPLDFCAALLSKASGRPVKITYSRQEVFQCTRQRHPMKVWLKTGYNRDGTLVAKQCRIIGDNGAYNSSGPTIIGRAGAQLSMVYKVRHLEFRGLLVYTNNPVGGAFRGFGNMQARFADDSQMDMIAEDLHMDPIQIRLKNARQAGETSPHGWKAVSCGLTECIQKVKTMADWDARKKGKIKNRGLGIACNAYVSGVNAGHDTSSALVKVEIDGTVTLITGATDIGQGSDTILCQIAAEAMGVPLESVRIMGHDTDVAPFDCGTVASRVTMMAGRAAQEAALDARRQLVGRVSDLLEARPEDLDIRGGHVYIKGMPDPRMSFAEAVRASLYAKGAGLILGRGVYNPPTEKLDIKTGAGNLSPGYSFGAQVVDVEVNPITGRVKILKVFAAHDCGTAINPSSVEGQVEGSIAQGLGYALTEELQLEKGEIKNASFFGYKIPTMLDMPPMETVLVEAVDPEGPFGAKGVSEGTILPLPPALANAVYDATGIRVKELPITPEKILGIATVR
jgi:4-hydroxybenzoyl-CoA reductase alpha subunit